MSSAHLQILKWFFQDLIFFCKDLHVTDNSDIFQKGLPLPFHRCYEKYNRLYLTGFNTK